MKVFVVALALVAMVGPSLVAASEISIRPFLIDKTLVPRESASEVIRLQNDYAVRKAVIFATVNEITVGTDGDIKQFVSPVMTDRTNTVTSWIKIQRGRIEVPAGETVDVPLTISVHPHAQPGEYHLFIGLVEARNRSVAEERALAGDAPGVVVKVTIDDERVDSMRVASMQVDRFITNPEQQHVAVTVANAGELESAPSGELVFYNSRGAEVAAVDVNTQGATIKPGDEKTFSVPVPFDDDLGRFKANLTMRYGKNQQASLHDTTTFFMMPLWYLALFGVGLLALVAVTVLLVGRNLRHASVSEHGDDVTMFVRDGHDPNPLDHDIDLTTKQKKKK